MLRRLTAGLFVSLFSLGLPQAQALDPIDTRALVNAVDEAKIRAHLTQLQAIANQNAGTRAAGTSGYTASAAYVRNRLFAAGYDVEVQPFTANIFEENSPPAFFQIEPRRFFRPNV